MLCLWKTWKRTSQCRNNNKSFFFVWSCHYFAVWPKFRTMNVGKFCTQVGKTADRSPVGHHHAKQEAQMMLTNLRDAFIGHAVKITKHSIIPYVRYSFLLCNSNFVFICFYDILLQKCRDQEPSVCDLENRVRGPSRSLEMSSVTGGCSCHR